MKKLLIALALALPMVAVAATTDYEGDQITQTNNANASGQTPSHMQQKGDWVPTSDAGPGPGPEEEQLYMPEIQTTGDGTYEDVDEYGD